MSIRVCRNCGSDDISKLPGGELGRESFHCKDCGSMGEPRTFSSRQDYEEFKNAVKSSEKAPAKKEGGFGAWIGRNYKKIIIGGILLMLLIFISIAALGVYVIMKYALPPAENTSTEEVSCDPPFVRIGQSCCVDANANGVCDIDDAAAPPATTTPAATVSTTVEATTSVATTSVTSTVATTVPTTTTSAPATTTLAAAAIKCYKDSDCGNTITSCFCRDDDIYERFEIWDCRNNGTTDAMCMVRYRGVNDPNQGHSQRESCRVPKKCVKEGSVCKCLS